MINAALYVHFPICLSKCSYCSFKSFALSDIEIEYYINAMVREIEMYCNQDDYNITTVYFGGGTPSSISNKHIERVISKIRKFSNFNPSEFTIECNPDDVCTDKLSCYRDNGINRVSMGIQSLNDRTLKALQRRHNATTALNAMEIVRKYYDNCSIDVMIGLPFEENNDGLELVSRAIDMDIPHISAYYLTLEQGTKLYEQVQKSQLVLPNDDITVDRYDNMYDYMKSKNVNRYEISNFAKEGKECRHNISYWEMDNYIGVGLSSHGYLGKTRYSNEINIQNYIDKVLMGKLPIIEKNILNYEKIQYETVMLSLRMTKGLSLKRYRKSIGRDFQLDYNDKISELSKYLLITEDHICVKPEYMGILNSILVELL